MGYLVVLSFAILIAMAGQDFKFRAIYWWLFLVLFVVLGAMKVLEGNWTVLFTDLGYNATFLGFQILVLSGYFSVQQRSWVNIFREHFGIGDLLFLLSIAGYCSFFNYVLFYILSLVCCVLASLLINVYYKGFKRSIPLAGMQAIVFGCCIGMTLLNTNMVLTSDLGLVNFFGF